MRSKAPDAPVRSPTPGVTPDPGAAVARNGSRLVREPDDGRTQASPATPPGGETRTEHFRRKAHRTRLHGYAIAGVAIVAFLVALAATNTARVKVSWVFGTSHVSLVWLVLFAALLGWGLGLVATAAFHWRTAAPRRGGAAS
jgi:uncharacterized integral membrane protein